MITPFLVLILSCWILNGDLTLAILSLLKRTIIVLSSILSIGAEESQGLTALVSIKVLTIVGFIPRSTLSESFGENSKSKDPVLLLLFRFGPQLHGGT